MDRRTFLAAGAALNILNAEPSDESQSALPGTTPLSEAGDLAVRMVDDINAYLLAVTAASVSGRARLWNRNYDSVQKYEESVAGNREHLRKIIGATDSRLSVTALELDTTTSTSPLITVTERYKVYAVRWRV